MPKPFNILRVITWLPPGGIEKKIVAVLPRLDPERFRPRVLCIKRRGSLAKDLEAAGVPVDLIETGTRLNPIGIWRIARYLREHRIDLVHAHMYRSAVPATIAARLAGVPIVTQVHNVNTWQNWRQVRMDRFLSRWRVAMIGVSEAVRQDMLATLRLPPPKARLIYNGVDVAGFAPADDPRAARRAAGLPADAVVVLMAARLVAQKNPEGFVEVAARLAKRFPEALFAIAGKGKLEEALRQRIEALGMAGRIRLLGLCQPMAPVYQAADLFVLPSFKEGFSNALIEALASGLPAVASNVGGAAEALEGVQGGIIVPPGDLEALERGIAVFLSDPALRRAKAAEARQRAGQFSLEAMVAQVEALYGEILGPPA